MSTNLPTLPGAPGRTNPLGLASVILAVIGFALAFAGPVALLAWLFTLPGFILSIIGLTRKNRLKVTSVAGVIISTVAFITSIITFSVYETGLPTHDAASQAIIATHTPHASSTHSATSTPTPTPLPTVPNASSTDLTADTTALTDSGYTVVFVNTSGATVTQLSGYTFVKQSPAPGTPLAVGGEVTITVKAPPPPAPKVVKPAPKPPAAPSHPAGASARCRDGSYSYSAHRQGTCSHHGGVAIWY